MQRSEPELGLYADPDRILLWDLDGTIADTSRDLAAAINRMLADYGYAPLPVPVVVGHIGKGAQNLVARCLEEYGHRLEGDAAADTAARSGDTATSPGDSAGGPGDSVADALSTFERHYAAHLMDQTEVYPGVGTLLRELARAGRRMAVVTNKPERFSRDILDRLGLVSCFVTVVGGETLPVRKPAPEPLWYAIRACGRERAPVSSAADLSRSAVMLGDTWIDAGAARAAGLPVILVGWGLGDREKARASEPNAWVETVEELRELLFSPQDRR